MTLKKTRRLKVFHFYRLISKGYGVSMTLKKTRRLKVLGKLRLVTKLALVSMTLKKTRRLKDIGYANIGRCNIEGFNDS